MSHYITKRFLFLHNLIFFFIKTIQDNYFYKSCLHVINKNEKKTNALDIETKTNNDNNNKKKSKAEDQSLNKK